MIFSVQIGTMNVGLGLTTAAHGGVLLNSYAVHTVVLAHFLIPGDRLTPAKVGGVLVAYTGIVLLFARDFSFQSSTLLGDVVVLGSAVLLGERVVYMARAVQRLDPVKLLVFQSAIGSACFLIASLVFESETPPATPGARHLALLSGRGDRRASTSWSTRTSSRSTWPARSPPARSPPRSSACSSPPRSPAITEPALLLRRP